MLLSTTRLEELCQSAMQAGALGAKLTGGGGGGCMIALCADLEQAEHVRVALGDQAFVTEAG
jgi:mevalonate kinase